MPNSERESLIAAWLDGRLNETESEFLQLQLRESAEARSEFRMYSELDAALRAIAGGDLGAQGVACTTTNQLSAASASQTLNHWMFGVGMWTQLAIAASVLIAVGSIAYRLGKSDVVESSGQIAIAVDQPSVAVDQPSAVTERTIAGHASLRRIADIQWPSGGDAYREGDVLPAGVLEFNRGVAEIDFFCGATIVVEGPAKMELESDWSVRLLAGRLRANVPPAARGFVVKAADSEIIDLGTEFALDVAPGNVRVEVIDGEVKLRGGEHDGAHLVTGQGQSLQGDESGRESLQSLSTIGDVIRRQEIQQRQRFTQWKKYSQQLRTDDRLIAYYPIAESTGDRTAPNMASSGHELDGTLVGQVNRTVGRFGSESAGLQFNRTGSRVRTRIDGEFSAFTFSCWARIDSLEHVYNSLFMGDGYENGEPHWQIRNDGRLMFSVMVDDTQNIPRFDKTDQQIVTTAGLHYVYITEPIWDITKSGQWFHIAAVYDPAARQVTQYVNGEQISSEEITPKYHIETLRIGPAEIGNWGQPFRVSPWFAVRNLNGVVDELAIFNSPLNSEEIQMLYENGKPLGY